MSVRRAFKAKVLARDGGDFVGEVVTFGEDDSPNPLNLDDPFICLEFAEAQVRQRTNLEGVEDYEVVMKTLSNDGSGLVEEKNTVRPWRYPTSAQHYASAR